MKTLFSIFFLISLSFIPSFGFASARELPQDASFQNQLRQLVGLNRQVTARERRVQFMQFSQEVERRLDALSKLNRKTTRQLYEETALSELQNYLYMESISLENKETCSQREVEQELSGFSNSREVLEGRSPRLSPMGEITRQISLAVCN